MDNFDDLFSNEGWIVAKNVDGKIKVTLDCQDKTGNFNETTDNWMTIRGNSELTENESNQILEKKKIKAPFKDVVNGNILTGFLFIRDLLNLRKLNNLSSVFLVDGIPIKTVAVCARIISVEVKNSYYRLVLDDGTSAILCMVKKIHTLDNSRDEGINSSTCNSTMDNSNTSQLLQKLELHSQKLIRETSTDFNQSSLGIPVMVMGNLQEFHGKNFIFAYNVRRVTEEYFIDFLNYVIQTYEYKKNFMYEYNLLLI